MKTIQRLVSFHLFSGHGWQRVRSGASCVAAALAGGVAGTSTPKRRPLPGEPCGPALCTRSRFSRRWLWEGHGVAAGLWQEKKA